MYTFISNGLLADETKYLNRLIAFFPICKIIVGQHIFPSQTFQFHRRNTCHQFWACNAWLGGFSMSVYFYPFPSILLFIKDHLDVIKFCAITVSAKGSLIKCIPSLTFPLDIYSAFFFLWWGCSPDHDCYDNECFQYLSRLDFFLSGINNILSFATPSICPHIQNQLGPLEFY